ncbi:hypothetical protein [Kitasatospora indigofera]|uniref:hypothetical protein n=1 Tax=Kitasatospora indigofera TaxID=67307 RepID=UPI003690B74A
MTTRTLAPVPSGAATLIKAGEKAGWTIEPDVCGDDSHRVYVLTGTNGAGTGFSATWVGRNGRWRLHEAPSVQHEGSEWLRADKLGTALAFVENNPAPAVLPITPAHIGRCDAVEQAHGTAPAVAVRLYYVFNGNETSEKIGSCAQCAAVRAHRPVADFPVWQLTDEDREAIAEQVGEYVESVREEAAREWASELHWGEEYPYDIPTAFDEWYAKADAIDPAAAYARWSEEQGQPLTHAQRVALGLITPHVPVPETEPTAPATWQCGGCRAHNGMGEPECTVCGFGPLDSAEDTAHAYAEEAEHAPAPLAAARAQGLYTMVRTGHGAWSLTVYGELYALARLPRRAAYAVFHAGADATVRVTEPADTVGSLTAAAAAAKAHAKALRERCGLAS